MAKRNSVFLNDIRLSRLFMAAKAEAIKMNEPLWLLALDEKGRPVVSDPCDGASTTRAAVSTRPRNERWPEEGLRFGQ